MKEANVAFISRGSILDSVCIRLANGLRFSLVMVAEFRDAIE